MQPAPRHRVGRRVGTRQIGWFDYARDALDTQDAPGESVEDAVGLHARRREPAVVVQEQHAGVEFEPLARRAAAPANRSRSRLTAVNIVSSSTR